MEYSNQPGFWKLALAVMMFLLAGTGTGMAADFTEFSADTVELDASGKLADQGKIYQASDRMRVEQTVGNGSKLIMIYRRDKHELWGLNPEKKVYVQMPLDDKKWEQQAKGMVKSKDTRVLGKETVNGFSCKKEEITTNMEIMGRKHTSRQTVWVSEKLGVPIRTRHQSGRITELRNIKIGKPAAENFEIPAGYKNIGNNMTPLFMSMTDMTGGKR